MVRRQWTWLPTLGLFLLLGAGARCAMAAESETNPWASGTQWMTLRAGYAKSSVDGSANGGAGYGFGYSRQLHKLKIYRWTLFKNFSLGGYIHHEVLGRFSGAAEIEVPASLELVRHFDWNTQMRPYVGFGAGPFYRKTYRTGDDLRNVKFGSYVAFGANAPVSHRSLVGLDIRWIRVDGTNDPPNPVFGLGSAKLRAGPNGPTIERGNATHWSVKLGYSRVY